MAPFPQVMKPHNLQPRRETSRNFHVKTTKGVISSSNKVKVWDENETQTRAPSTSLFWSWLVVLKHGLQFLKKLTGAELYGSEQHAAFPRL